MPSKPLLQYEPSHLYSNLYKPCYLLYIDFLGTTERIRDEAYALCPPVIAIDHLYEFVKSFIEEKNPKYPSLNPPYINVFSDNIAIVYEISDDEAESKKQLQYLIELAGCFQINALTTEYWFTRGCLTAGYLYFGSKSILKTPNDPKYSTLDFILGPALIRAAQIESTIAKYPRIIVDIEKIPDTNISLAEKVRTIFTDTKWLIPFDEKETAECKHQFYWLDFLYIYAYIECCCGNELVWEDCSISLSNCDGEIEKKRIELQDKDLPTETRNAIEHILEKYCWMKTYLETNWPSLEKIWEENKRELKEFGCDVESGLGGWIQSSLH